jgi:hypothetical protein
MANIPFRSITFPGLPNKYTVPEISNDLMTAGKAADAKATGDALSALEDAVTEETDKLKADLGDLKSATLSVTEIEYVSKKYVRTNAATVTMVDGEPQMDSTNNFNCAVLPCVEGDVLTVNGTGGSTARLWAFVDASGNVLTAARNGASADNMIISAPENAAWIILHNSTSVVAKSYKGQTTVSAINDLQNTVSKLNETEVVNIGLKNGNITSTGDTYSTNTRVKSNIYLPIDGFVSLSGVNGAVGMFIFYNADKQFISGTSSFYSSISKDGLDDIVPENCVYMRIVGKYSNDGAITDVLAFANNLTVKFRKDVLNSLQDEFLSPESNKIFDGNVGNMSIVCAKEHTNDSGNLPVIEWYLLEEAGATNRFFISKDLVSKELAFIFNGNAYMYSFGVLSNGDIIAILDASSIDWDDAGSVARSESFRKNPYVFLASENWSVQHEVDFGDNLKPLGWLSNYGFRTLPDGSTVFAEYTRYCVLTANVWRINGDPTDYTNWNTVISLSLPDPGQDMLKHWHTVQYDPYSNIVYAATGDSNSGSLCYYSSDYGVTWTQLLIDGVDHSSKYFRFLNLIFTENTIYWAKDWYDAEHYLFKCGRDSNGVMDINNVIDYIQIPQVENLSTYTTCYMPEIDAILLLEREDSGGGTNAPAPIRLCDLENGTLHTIAYMRSAKGVREQIGFRTRYSEVYPQGGMVNIGWQLRRQQNANAVNLLDWYDNSGNDNTPYMSGLTNVNNLWLQVYKNSTGYHLKVGTRLI